MKHDANSIKCEASVPVEDRFAEIIFKGGEADVLFYAEIRTALQDCGLGQLSSENLLIARPA